MTESALYRGAVSHTRLKPARHDLRYRVFMGLFDLDELPELAQRTWAFGYNKPSLISFFERDHGDGSGAALRSQIETALSAIGVTSVGCIQVLCMPRVLGYVFNPICVYFCDDEDGDLAAIVHEVNNTFGERHLYALPARVQGDGRVVQVCEKAFRVSPFLPMALKYQFNIDPPGEKTRVAIIVSDADGVVLTASFKGERRPFTSWQIVRLWLAHPALTFKVLAGIHWEAIWIWLKLRRAARRNTSSPAAAR